MNNQFSTAPIKTAAPITECNEKPSVWMHMFTFDLRIRYNQCLENAINEANGMPMIFVFILDESFWKFSLTKNQFIYDSVQELNRKLGGRILWFHCSKAKMLETMFSIPDFKITAISYEKPVINWYLNEIDTINQICHKNGAETFEYEGMTIFSSSAIDKLIGEDTVLTLEKFYYIIDKIDFSTYANITSLPLEDILKMINFCDVSNLSQFFEPTRLNFLELASEEDLPEVIFKGGEDEGMFRLKKKYIPETHFSKCLIDVNDPSNTTWFTRSQECLSPYLANGCVSMKLFFKRLVMFCGKDEEKIRGSNLLQRDYYNVLNIRNTFYTEFMRKLYKHLTEMNTERHFEAFCNGKIGFPLVDAVLRQTVQEGWVNSMGRALVVVAGTSSGLLMPWERGVEFYATYHIDFDYVVSVGVWIKHGFSNPIFVDIVKVGKELDPEGIVIRQFVKELRNMPTEYIHEPWNAPLSVQEQAGCIIGKDYPERLFDNTTQYIKNRELYAYCGISTQHCNSAF